MREGIGLTYSLNFIIIFIVITFAFLFGIMSYYKAFKVNSRISNAIENHEGWNNLSNDEVTNVLTTLGYQKGSVSNCPSKNNMTLVAGGSASVTEHMICIYEQNNVKNNEYFKYGIVTYISMDIPLVGQTLRLPIYTQTEKIYKFSA